MNKQPTIRVTTAAGLVLELCAHRTGLLYSATLDLDNRIVAFFSVRSRPLLKANHDGTSDLWLESACVTVTAESAEQCAQFLADTIGYNEPHFTKHQRERDAALLAAFDGANHADLAQRFCMTEQSIRRLIQRVSKPFDGGKA